MKPHLITLLRLVSPEPYCIVTDLLYDCRPAGLVHSFRAADPCHVG